MRTGWTGLVYELDLMTVPVWKLRLEVFIHSLEKNNTLIMLTQIILNEE